MNLSAIGGGIRKAAKKSVKFLGSISPEIMLVTGIAGIIVTVVEAVKAAPEAAKVTESLNDQIAAENEIGDNPESEFDAAEHRKALLRIYIYHYLQYAKVYAKPLVIGIASIGLIGGSHGIVRHWYNHASNTLNGITVAYNALKAKLVEKYGPEEANRLIFGDEETTFEKIEKSPEGKSKIVKEKAVILNEKTVNPFVFIMTADSTGGRQFNFDPVTMAAFLQKKDAEVTYRLQELDGFVWLSDILPEYGLKDTKISRKAGWVFGGMGDDEVNCRPTFGYIRRGDRMVPAVRLDFNCDGDITNLVEKYRKDDWKFGHEAMEDPDDFIEGEDPKRGYDWLKWRLNDIDLVKRLNEKWRLKHA